MVIMFEVIVMFALLGLNARFASVVRPPIFELNSSSVRNPPSILIGPLSE